MITPQYLMAAVGCSPAAAMVWAPAFEAACPFWQIDTKARMDGFFAQIAVESQYLSVFEENLNYSAQRLSVVWPHAFSDPLVADQYALNPRKLANYIYANRMGNGDEASGDGWMFHGRGPIQITGRLNYTNCGFALDIDLLSSPSYVLTPYIGAETACWYWGNINGNALMDKGDFHQTTIAINGGTGGYDARLVAWARAKSAIWTA